MITTVTLNASVDKLYLVDTVTPDTVMRVAEVSNTAGGKGLNVSKVAALAGEKVVATGFLGGFNGKYVASMLTAAGIIARFTEIETETRSCINIRNLATGRHTEYLEPGASVTEKDLGSFMRTFKKVLQQSDVVTISGSTPKGTPETFYANIVRLCRDAGKPVIIDTSGNLLIEAIKAKPTLIKPNKDEIEQLLGEDVKSLEQIIYAAKKLHEGGVAYVAVSLGRDGSILVCDEGVFKGKTLDIPVVNTVGCGDSMVAGFAVSMSRGYNAEETLRFATAISTANALEMQTGHIIKEKLEKLLPQITVIKLL